MYNYGIECIVHSVFLCISVVATIKSKSEPVPPTKRPGKSVIVLYIA